MVDSQCCAEVQGFFDKATYTITYIVSDPVTRKAAIIDPVLDFDAKACRTRTHSADQILDYVAERSLTVDWLLETHVHADHLTAAVYLKQKLGCPIGIGEKIKTVQRTFKSTFDLGEEFQPDGSQFDHLFRDGEMFSIGNLNARVLHTPGHTPACVTYCMEHQAFVGDTLFMPEFGTARCDFPGGNSSELYNSIRKILALPQQTILYVGHEYPPADTGPRFRSTVAEQRAQNIHVNDSVGESQFIEMRTKRDVTLDMPTLIIPAIQVNIRAGHFPSPAGNGVRYLKMPLNVF